ncbi:MAG: 50S ribosomal protein L35 [Minisyncoccia bacterium]|jgi:ribosomal protein L35
MSKKTILKRVKITKNSKILHRISKQGHNQAKKSPKVKRIHRKMVAFYAPHAKTIKKTT